MADDITKQWRCVTGAFYVLIQLIRQLYNSRSESTQLGINQHRQTVCYIIMHCTVYTVKTLKAFHTRYRALGPELIPVYRQSACRWFEAIHPAAGCHCFPPGLRLPSHLQSITAPWPVPSNTAWLQRHIGVTVSNLPEVVTQLLPRVGFELTTCWLQVQRSTHCAIAPPVYTAWRDNVLYNLSNIISSRLLLTSCLTHPIYLYHCSTFDQHHLYIQHIQTIYVYQPITRLTNSNSACMVFFDSFFLSQ